MRHEGEGAAMLRTLSAEHQSLVDGAGTLVKLEVGDDVGLALVGILPVAAHFLEAPAVTGRTPGELERHDHLFVSHRPFGGNQHVERLAFGAGAEPHKR